MVSTKILSSTTVLNIDNNKLFMSTNSVEWFLKDHVILKTEDLLLMYFLINAHLPALHEHFISSLEIKPTTLVEPAAFSK